MKLTVFLGLALVACVTAQRPTKCDQEDAVSEDPKGRCDKYIKCENGWEVLQTCIKPGTLYWAAHKDLSDPCAPPSEVFPPCGTKTTTQRTPTTGGLAECDEEGAVSKDPKGRCDKYVKCINGWEVLHSCVKPGTVYCARHKDLEDPCTPPSEVRPPCGTRTTTIATTTQREPTTPTTTFCTGRPSGSYLEDEMACTNKYLQCHEDGKVEALTCPEPHSFSPEEGGCVPQQDNGLCDKNACRDQPDGLYVHPEGNCDEYLSCIRGWPVIIRCLLENEAWNDDEKRCMDRALFEPPCGTYEPTTAAPNECEGREDGIYPHSDPAICDEYLSCIKGWPVISSCSEPNEAWNAAVQRCMDRNLFPPPCGTYEPTTILPFSCDGRAPGNYPESEECSSSFYQCHNDELPQTIKCPPGLVFGHEGKCVPLKDCRKP